MYFQSGLDTYEMKDGAILVGRGMTRRNATGGIILVVCTVALSLMSVMFIVNAKDVISLCTGILLLMLCIWSGTMGLQFWKSWRDLRRFINSVERTYSI